MPVGSITHLRLGARPAGRNGEDMRVASAASIKRKGKASGKAGRRDIPTEGTNLRLIYDNLLANRGIEIEIIIRSGRNSSDLGSIIQQLRDFYGLDIRARKQAGAKRRAYCLAGEYFGSHYVSYMNAGVQTCESPPVPEGTGGSIEI